jgi:hypothetical protein
LYELLLQRKDINIEFKKPKLGKECDGKICPKMIAGPK